MPKQVKSLNRWTRTKRMMRSGWWSSLDMIQEMLACGIPGYTTVSKVRSEMKENGVNLISRKCEITGRMLYKVGR